jgi:hypothetical protein
LTKVVLDHGVSIDNHILSSVASGSSPKTLKLILSNCDGSVMNESQALRFAAQAQNFTTLVLLLDAGMDINYVPMDLGLDDIDPIIRHKTKQYYASVWARMALHWVADC